jgi:hypothetical protein
MAIFEPVQLESSSDENVHKRQYFHINTSWQNGNQTLDSNLVGDAKLE